MGGFLKDVKDSDKVGLLLLFTGLFVTLLGTGSDIVLRVSDSGSGFDDSGPRAGLGLVSMRERVAK